MSLNQAKRFFRRALPAPIFKGIQKIRKLGYHPPPQIETLKLAFEELQRSTKPGELAIRQDIVLRIDEQSRHPFEWFCWRSPEMVRELDSFIERCRGATSFADIGANHGIFSLVFLKLNPGGMAISVDPSPIASKIRLMNRSLNQMDSHLGLYEVACGASDGSVKMHFNWHHLEVSSSSDDGQNTLEIEVKPLDKICAEVGLAPEIIKIDVEGFEHQVLQGAEQSLQNARLLFLEIHPERLDELSVRQAEIFEWLDSRGWSIKTHSGDRFSAARFKDQIHTFWTICERQSSS